MGLTAGPARLEAVDFPGRQGRLVFAALVLEAGPVDRNELAEILWPNRLPSSWTRDLSAVISKLRSLLAGIAEFTTGSGRWYAVTLPTDASIDVLDALRAIDEGSGELGRAIDVLAEPFLAGDECAWV